jgi:hypothetical protein
MSSVRYDQDGKQVARRASARNLARQTGRKFYLLRFTRGACKKSVKASAEDRRLSHNREAIVTE